MRLNAKVHTEAKVPMEDDGTDQDEATVATAIGPQERRRLMLASMSPEDIVSELVVVVHPITRFIDVFVGAMFRRTVFIDRCSYDDVL